MVAVQRNEVRPGKRKDEDDDPFLQGRGNRRRSPAELGARRSLDSFWGHASCLVLRVRTCCIHCFLLLFCLLETARTPLITSRNHSDAVSDLMRVCFPPHALKCDTTAQANENVSIHDGLPTCEVYTVGVEYNRRPMHIPIPCYISKFLNPCG